MAIHGCMADGCDRRISVNKLMCAEHWERVPKDWQGKVYAALRKWKAAMSRSASEAVAAGDELRAVQRKAIEAADLVPCPAM